MTIFFFRLYYFLPFWDEKPSLYVRTALPDHRLYVPENAFLIIRTRSWFKRSFQAISVPFSSVLLQMFLKNAFCAFRSFSESWDCSWQFRSFSWKNNRSPGTNSQSYALPPPHHLANAEGRYVAELNYKKREISIYLRVRRLG